MFCKKNLIFFLTVMMGILPLICVGREELKHCYNAPDLHLKYISKNADLVELSNGTFFKIYLDHRYIVSRWCQSDPVSLRYIQEPRITFLGLFEGIDLKGEALYNMKTKEEVKVDFLPIRPAAYTLDQPSYPYLHLKYVDKRGYDTLIFQLSDGKKLAVRSRESKNIFLSWSCSDALFYKAGGLFSNSRLDNITKGESITVGQPPP